MTKKDIKQTYGENTTCDFKEAVERKLPKSWLKILNKTGKLLEDWDTNRKLLYDWIRNLIWLENHFLQSFKFNILIINNIFIWRLFDWKHKKNL